MSTSSNIPKTGSEVSVGFRAPSQANPRTDSSSLGDLVSRVNVFFNGFFGDYNALRKDYLECCQHLTQKEKELAKEMKYFKYDEKIAYSLAAHDGRLSLRFLVRKDDHTRKVAELNKEIEAKNKDVNEAEEKLSNLRSNLPSEAAKALFSTTEKVAPKQAQLGLLNDYYEL